MCLLAECLPCVILVITLVNSYLYVLTAIFPDECEVAGFIKLRTMLVTTGAISLILAKLQSNHHQQTNIQLFTGGMPFLSHN